MPSTSGGMPLAGITLSGDSMGALEEIISPHVKIGRCGVPVIRGLGFPVLIGRSLPRNSESSNRWSSYNLPDR